MRFRLQHFPDFQSQHITIESSTLWTNENVLFAAKTSPQERCPFITRKNHKNLLEIGRRPSRIRIRERHRFLVCGLSLNTFAALALPACGRPTPSQKRGTGAARGADGPRSLHTRRRWSRRPAGVRTQIGGYKYVCNVHLYHSEMSVVLINFRRALLFMQWPIVSFFK